MSIADEVAKVTSGDKRVRGEEFAKQLEQHKEFRKWMSEAGVVPNKKEFTIPLNGQTGVRPSHFGQNS